MGGPQSESDWIGLGVLGGVLLVHLYVGLLGGLLRETLVGAPGLVLCLVLESQSAGLLDVHIANGGLLEETVEFQELGIRGLLGELLGEFSGFLELFSKGKSQSGNFVLI